MNQMRRVCLVVALFLLLVSQAGAWEFSLSGVYTWEFYQFSQLGSNGFLGPFNQDESSVKNTVRLAARNGWLGHEITSPTFYNFWGDRLATGSDVAANYMYTLFYPKVKVNQALSLQGTYRIGAWNPINISDAALWPAQHLQVLEQSVYRSRNVIFPRLLGNLVCGGSFALGNSYIRESSKQYRPRCDYRLPGKHRRGGGPSGSLWSCHYCRTILSLGAGQGSCGRCVKLSAGH